jgi:hypothetical protein
MSNSVNARSCENNGGRTYPPFLSNSIKSLTEDPRSMEGMIGEHLDNALDAGATKFKITTERGDAGVVSRVILCDDGSGMDYEELDLSFHLGRPGDWGPRPGKLGRFGVGGTMSAMQKANRKTTVTWNGVPPCRYW